MCFVRRFAQSEGNCSGLELRLSAACASGPASRPHLFLEAAAEPRRAGGAHVPMRRGRGAAPHPGARVIPPTPGLCRIEDTMVNV